METFEVCSVCGDVIVKRIHLGNRWWHITHAYADYTRRKELGCLNNSKPKGE